MEEIKFPVYKKGIYSGTVVRFDSLNSGEVLKDTKRYNVGHYSNNWADCLDKEVWEDVEWDEESKSEIGQPIIEETIDVFVNNFEQYGFKGNFSGEILKECKNGYLTTYVGYYYDTIGRAIGATWDISGYCGQSAFFNNNLTPIVKEWYEEDYWVFVKDRGENSYPNSPQKKFKFAWTEGMCKNLRESGWRLASDEELELMKKHRNKD